MYSASSTIDPRVRHTLDKLDSLVGSSGSLRSAQEVPKLIRYVTHSQLELPHPQILKENLDPD